MMQETLQMENHTVFIVKEPSSLYLILKRSLDIIVALVGLVFAFAIILLFCFLIVLESSGSPFFLQERLGRGGEKFTIIKLRSMRLDAEKNGAQWASKHDSRVTRIGAFIRKTRIDELPQLWNVLKGDMSIIGPRPERNYFYNEFEKYIPGFRSRLIVKPGLTGWAQVNGGYDISPDEKLRLDLFYINHASFRLDIRILLKTVMIIFTGEGAR